MSTRDAKSLPAVGFLTVCKYADLGLIGGYLILNTNGRPLEFHCTAPVRPNRAQEILYGPTLEPFLFGEQIGQALAAKSNREPLFICTDVEQVLSLRDHISEPVVYLSREAESGQRGDLYRIDSAHSAPSEPWRAEGFKFGGHFASISRHHPSDHQTVLDRWAPHSGGFDLLEPFARLSEAIEETQSGAGR
jgi:hypothetical protein